MDASDEMPIASRTKDLYHQGVITKLFPSNGTGIVRTESGRELPFSYDLVILCGEAKTAHELREGEHVGYDLGWTSSGLRITKIKTYPRKSSESLRVDLERQKGEGENLSAQDLPDKNP
jgi:hypothetical protein